MKLYIIAGENSGDFIGSKLIEKLPWQANGTTTPLNMSIVGGPKMQKESGLMSLFPMHEINIMGFLEIIPHIFRIKKRIDETVNDIINKNPDLLITIDSPGFTYRVAKRVRELNKDIKLVHIVAPSVWAYKPGRALKYAKLYDNLLTLLPFEPPYFTKLGLNTICMGHPVLEQNFKQQPDADYLQKLNIATGAKIITITPGSRTGEIKKHMPIIAEAMNKMQKSREIHVIFVQPNENNFKLIKSYLSAASFSYSFSTDRLNSYAVADVALAKSGTNTIEISASRTPMIVFYKLNLISYFLIKMMIKIKYASIINIIADKEVIPELLQNNFSASNIIQNIESLLHDGNSQVEEASNILSSLRNPNGPAPSEIAASEIFKIAKNKNNS